MAYEPTPIEQLEDQALWNIRYHRIPLDDTATQDAMGNIRDSAAGFIHTLFLNMDPNRPRENQMAMRCVEDAVMYAIAGLARGRESRVRPD